MVKTQCYAILLASLGCITAQLGESFPTISLPWGTWQAATSPNTDKLYVFNNVRFGDQPPRFGVPNFPTYTNSTLQDSSYGPSCYQIDTSQLKNPPGGTPNVQLPLDGSMPQSEDCLFLDIYAPASNFDENGKPIKQLPVIVWFYGGAYAFGSKNLGGDLPLYTGQSMLAAQDYQAVFVAGNYRLGAFGWLAGSYMESAGQPNAGLYDQSLLLSWVKNYIAKAGGDPTNVSAWGESAGAGSILHHLIREGGTKDPLFRNFLVQSPAFEWSWDNSKDGTLDNVYRTFSNLSGCGYTYDISCLRDKNITDLIQPNQDLFANVKQTGIFPIGPSVDGQWIQTIPALSFANNKYWPSIDNALISHVYNETASFTPSYVVSQATFDQFLEEFFPEPTLGPVRSAINSEYNCMSNYGGDFRLCVATMIRDSAFTCNTRQLFNAFPSISYMLRYSFYEEALAVHATDLIPTFMNGVIDAYNILVANDIGKLKAAFYAGLLDAGMSSWYQDYLSSFGVYGNPNTGAQSNAQQWPLATQGEEVGNVLEVYDDDSSRLIQDDQNTQSTCQFWQKMAGLIENISRNERSGKNVDWHQTQLEL